MRYTFFHAILQLQRFPRFVADWKGYVFELVLLIRDMLARISIHSFISQSFLSPMTAGRGTHMLLFKQLTGILAP